MENATYELRGLDTYSVGAGYSVGGSFYDSNSGGCPGGCGFCIGLCK
jgi:hypothetical protein